MANRDMLKQTLARLDKAAKDGVIALNDEHRKDLATLNALVEEDPLQMEEIHALLGKFTSLLLGDKHGR